MSEIPPISVVICTHNPKRNYLTRVLGALEQQRPLTSGRSWELVLVDNASEEPVASWVDLSWHPLARIVEEKELGLTRARIRGCREARSEIIVYVDDDNVLNADYLRIVEQAFGKNANLGALGGKVIPCWEATPPHWLSEFEGILACRDLGESEMEARWSSDIGDRTFPACAPVGAGMALRRSATLRYAETVTADAVRLDLDRKGASLSSGGDNDMILTVLGYGLTVAYLPQLRLDHLIPNSRTTPAYLERLAESGGKSWVFALAGHGIVPWPPVPAWTLPIRKLRAWARQRAWMGPANKIRWHGACGILDGRAGLRSLEKLARLPTNHQPTVS